MGIMRSLLRNFVSSNRIAFLAVGLLMAGLLVLAFRLRSPLSQETTALRQSPASAPPTSAPAEQPLPSQTAASPDSSQWLSYDSPTMGFSIKYPWGWNVSAPVPDLDGKRVEFQSNDPSTNFSFVLIRDAKVYSDAKGQYLTFEEVVEGQRDHGRAERDYTEAQVLIQSNPATLISYTSRWHNQDVRKTYIYQKKHNLRIYFSVYNFRPSLERASAPILVQMLSSLKLR